MRKLSALLTVTVRSLWMVPLIVLGAGTVALVIAQLFFVRLAHAPYDGAISTLPIVLAGLVSGLAHTRASAQARPWWASRPVHRVLLNLVGRDVAVLVCAGSGLLLELLAHALGASSSLPLTFGLLPALFGNLSGSLGAELWEEDQTAAGMAIVLGSVGLFLPSVAIELLFDERSTLFHWYTGSDPSRELAALVGATGAIGWALLHYWRRWLPLRTPKAISHTFLRLLAGCALTLLLLQVTVGH